MSDTRKLVEIYEQLFSGWDSTNVSYQAGFGTNGGFSVFLYIEKDRIMQRLDEVLGPHNWRVSYAALWGDATACKLELRLEGEWLAKEGIGGKPAMSKEQDAIKGGATDAFKQAAEAWGFGRHLGHLPDLIWPGNTSNGKWQSWKNEPGLRDAITRLLSGEPPAPPQQEQRQQGTQRTPPAPPPDPPKGPKPPVGDTTTRLAPVAELAAELTAPLSEPERAGYVLARAGAISKQGEHYLVEDKPKTATVWQKGSVTQCDCSPRRATKEAPMCRHIYAVKFAAAACKAQTAKAKPTTNTQASKTQ